MIATDTFDMKLRLILLLPLLLLALSFFARETAASASRRAIILTFNATFIDEDSPSSDSLSCQKVIIKRVTFTHAYVCAFCALSIGKSSPSISLTAAPR